MMTNEFELFHVVANGISHRIARVWGYPPAAVPRVVVEGQESSNPPLVMLLHGWPESWYSWRHQLLALARAGYHVCAPDMRGYGGTDAPRNVEDYAMDVIAKDIVGIARVLGYDCIVPVGHDFGSMAAWHTALLHPNTVVVAVAGLSVPHLGHSPRHMPPLERLKREYDWGDANNARFHYMLHHCLPRVAEEYDKHCREALYRLYAFHPGVVLECEPHDVGPEQVTDARMFPPTHHCRHDDDDDDNHHPLDARSAPGFWARLARPKTLPDWLSREDFEYFVTQFQQSGFAGGLRWYQALDISWHNTMRHLLRNNNDGDIVKQPAMFLGGEQDHLVWKNHGGRDSALRKLRQHCRRLERCVLIPGGGHWIQQQFPDKVSGELLGFLKTVVPIDDYEKQASLISKL